MCYKAVTYLKLSNISGFLSINKSVIPILKLETLQYLLVNLADCKVSSSPGKIKFFQEYFRKEISNNLGCFPSILFPISKS